MRSLLCVLAISTVVVSCSDGRNYPPRNFTWTGDIAPGATVNVSNIDGTIAIVPSTTSQLTVDAEILNAKPNAVEVQQSKDGNDLTFCTQIGSSGACASNSEHRHNVHMSSPWSMFSHRHTITVRYTLHVPAGVKVDVETVNGRIAGQNLADDVKASTVNGDVTISTTKGTVNAETVNGSIIASMEALPDSGNVHLETVNGSITSVIPEGIGGQIDLENANGTITANYPNAVPDKEDKHHLHIKLDDADRRVHLETVNGSVNLARYVKTAIVSLVN
jgi:hypothetical protein